MIVRTGDDLHKAAARIFDHGAGVGPHHTLADLHFNAGLLGLGIVHAHAGDLRTAVDAGRYQIQVHMVFLVADPVHAGSTLGGCHMGQLDPGGYIADGIDPGNGGFKTITHGDALAGFSFYFAGKQAVKIGLAADGAEHHFAESRTRSLGRFEIDRQAAFRRGDLLYHSAGKYRYALFL